MKNFPLFIALFCALNLYTDINIKASENKPEDDEANLVVFVTYSEQEEEESRPAIYENVETYTVKSDVQPNKVSKYFGKIKNINKKKAAILLLKMSSSDSEVELQNDDLIIVEPSDMSDYSQIFDVGGFEQFKEEIKNIDTVENYIKSHNFQDYLLKQTDIDEILAQSDLIEDPLIKQAVDDIKEKRKKPIIWIILPILVGIIGICFLPFAYDKYYKKKQKEGEEKNKSKKKKSRKKERISKKKNSKR